MFTASELLTYDFGRIHIGRIHFGRIEKYIVPTTTTSSDVSDKKLAANYIFKYICL